VIEQRTTVPADAAQLPALAQFLQAFWTAQKLPPAQALTFELALEEVFLNVVLHGAPPGPLPRIEVTLVLLGHDLTSTRLRCHRPTSPRAPHRGRSAAWAFSW
jgi:anti-sigma regulatory factor (Ser/Thr protein kinase)